ncbi:hypothetical protein AK812_SmicGene25929 [Symbiodinium microadriaticum]|uniref:Uncharacterized protein n=1 Tax=Symbiodinium microadriaticum TaxID=2951 RepID=A0A1Q9DAV3_SYMMI|nr:hypothetical protein AK812_SmicGene25929 [Symbiodinium microadriaticum]
MEPCTPRRIPLCRCIRPEASSLVVPCKTQVNMISFGVRCLLPCFFSVPVRTARVEVTVASEGASSLEPAWDEGLGCYCKTVKSDSDCTDRQGSDDQPDRLRWFHHARDGKDPMCCKLASTSMLSWVFVGNSGDPGFYVSRVTMFLRVAVISATQRTFRKSAPQFQIADIYAGKDYDGALVNDLSDVKAFVLKWLGEGQGKCSGPWDGLVQDTTRSCVLRNMPGQDCCCEEASVKEEQGCLPTGITGLSAEPGMAGEKSRELTRSAGLSFKCPEGYRSGTEFTTEYSDRAGLLLQDGPLCRRLLGQASVKEEEGCLPTGIMGLSREPVVVTQREND